MEKVELEGWIARDANPSEDELCLYQDCPVWYEAAMVWSTGHTHGEYISLPRETFPSLTWKDGPKRCRIKITTE